MNEAKKQQKILDALMNGKRRRKVAYYSFQNKHKPRYTPITDHCK